MLALMVAPGKGDVKARAIGTRHKAKGEKIESRLTPVLSDAEGNHDSRRSP
jgi:hypothetical protein